MAKTKTASKPARSAKKSPAAKGKPAKKTAKKTTPKSKSPAKRGAKAAKRGGEEEVTIDRRRKARRGSEQSEGTEAPQAAKKEAPKLERRQKVNRRRQIDPTTCERDYSDCEVEFMNALDDYKRKSGRMFPTCSEVLEVIRELGYTKLTPAELASLRPEQDPEATLDAAAEEEARSAIAMSDQVRLEDEEALV